MSTMPGDQRQTNAEELEVGDYVFVDSSWQPIATTHTEDGQVIMTLGPVSYEAGQPIQACAPITYGQSKPASEGNRRRTAEA